MAHPFYHHIQLAGRQDVLSDLTYALMADLDPEDPDDEYATREEHVRWVAVHREGIPQERYDAWLADCAARWRADPARFCAEAKKARTAALPAWRRRFVTMDEVDARQADYLVEPYLPRGMLSVMGGVSGVGKTWLVLSLAAAVSQGRRLPFQPEDAAPPEQGFVFYFSKENDLECVVAQRLEVLGADKSRIIAQRMDDVGLRMDDPDLDKLAAQYPPALVIFDPIQSYLGAGVEMNRANEVRPILDGLAAFAKRHDCAVLLVSHVTKPSGTSGASALDRLLGSSDFRNAARSILFVGSHPEEEGKRVFAHAKNSIGQPGPSQQFSLDDGGVLYEGSCELSADEIIRASGAAAAHRPSASQERAAALLEELLAPGSASLEQIDQAARAAHISRSVLYNARRELGVQTVQIGQPPSRRTYWLPAGADCAAFRQRLAADDAIPPPVS